MATAEYPMKYYGSIVSVPKWKHIINIFDEIWGIEARPFPKFPKVIGGVSGYWINHSNIRFQADSLDEIHKEFERGNIKELGFVGKLKEKASSVFIVNLDEKRVIVDVTSERFEVSDSVIRLAKKYFPTKGKEPQINKLSHEILAPNKKEIWYQNWWGQIIIGVVVTVIGGIVLVIVLEMMPYF